MSYQNNTLVGERIIEWNPDVMERQAAYGAFITENSVFSGEYSSVIVVHDDKLNWDVVNVTNQNEVVSRLKNQQKITLLALGLSLGALIILIVILIRSLTGSLQNLAAVMKQAGKGNLSARVEINKKMPPR